ncbi:MAG: hypothetical protein L6U16_07920 [Porphyromonadaceae bacterium]|nr:MAG: hypothetical protein L6U16_07920 [Porphyromonadaceae bacterium]
MYGMPSDARNFYHGYDYVKQEPRSIDRSSEMAISEFAPGAEKTKDKGQYRIEAYHHSYKKTTLLTQIMVHSINWDFTIAMVML